MALRTSSLGTTGGSVWAPSLLVALGETGLRRLAPFAAATVLLLLGYLHYAPGTAYNESPEAYRTWAFPAFQYSDIIWLYLRDNLVERPIPYLDYPLEYPPLTGLLSYLLSFAPGLGGYFTLTYLVLSGSALGTVAILGRLPGANPWYYAAAPALLFYPGSQWEPAPVFATVLALLAFGRGRDRWGAVAITAAVWLKFFPLAFIAAVLVDRARERRYRACFEIAGIFALGTILINAPVAAVAWDGWAFFFSWNQDRPADAGIWVLLRDLSTNEATWLSFGAAAVGGLGLVLLGVRARQSVTLPLGATLLLWWLLVNKTFTPHLILWVFLAISLLHPRWWMWVGFVAIDIATFQVINFQNLPLALGFQYGPIMRLGMEQFYDPLQVLRVGLQFIAVLWGIAVVLRPRPATIGGETQCGGPSSFRRREANKRAVRWLRSEPVRPWRAQRRLGRLVGRSSCHDETRSGSHVRTVEHTRWHRAVRGGLITITFLLITVVMTWPYPAHMREAVIDPADSLWGIWANRWVQHQLVTNPLSLDDANLFYPLDHTLASSSVMVINAVLTAPIVLLTGDSLLANGVLMLGALVAAAGGMYVFVRRLSGNRAAAFLAGLIFSFLPFRFAHLDQPHLLWNAWVPWILVALLALAERRSRRWPVALGLLLATPLLTSVDLALQAGWLVAVALAGLGATWVWDRLAMLISRGPATQHQTRMLGTGVTALVGVFLLAGLRAGPRPMEIIDTSATASAPYEWLANRPDDGAVMEFPAERASVGSDTDRARRRVALAMYWSTLHWKPLINGYSRFFPEPDLDDLAAFTGDLRRLDGSVARDVSHVNGRNVALLQQLGVRYLVFHRSQYSERDWPAVAAQLARLEGDVTKAGDFGEATIYLVEPSARPLPEPAFTISAPTMAGPGAPWEPALTLTNPGLRPALFSLTRSVKLRATWFDAEGREVRDEEHWLDVPAVVEPGRLDCSLRACASVTDDDALPTPPEADSPGSGMQPGASGRYTVRLDVRGEVAVRCEMEVEVAQAVPRERAGAWWSCAEGDRDEDKEVEPELREPSRTTTPGVLLVDGRITVATAFTSPTTKEIQAWFFLSRVGEDEPWRRFAFRSPTVRRLARSGEATEFGWVEPLDVPDGVYELTVWFQRRENGTWKHELGGTLGLGPILVARDRPTAGPFRLVPWEASAPAEAGEHATVRLAVAGSSATETCRTTWTLREQDDAAAGAQPETLASGQTWACGEVRAAVPPGLEPGRYPLEVTALATGEEGVRRSDRITVEVVVADWPGW